MKKPEVCYCCGEKCKTGVPFHSYVLSTFDIVGDILICLDCHKTRIDRVQKTPRKEWLKK